MKKLKILLVDDSRFVLKLTTRILESIGITHIDTAASGVEGLKKLTKKKFDIVLMDLNMPEMDGVELIERLGEEKIDVALIIMSGESQKVLHICKQVAGAYGLDIIAALHKPFNTNDLTEVVQGFVDRIEKQKTSKIKFLPLKKIEAELQGKTNNLRLFYQPKVCAETQKMVGVEALVRWIDSKGNIYSPAAFVPTINEHGLDRELTRRVLNIGIEELGRWTRDGIKLKTSFNISTDDLQGNGFIAELVSLCAQHGVSSQSVVLEVLEDRIMGDIKKPLAALARLRMRGFDIALDDFGVGASNLEQLRLIPCTEIKIDRMFISNADTNYETRQILSSMVHLGKALDLKVIAEGVETQEQWDMVIKMGVDQVQGYYTGKPMSSADIIDYYAEMAEWTS